MCPAFLARREWPLALMKSADRCLNNPNALALTLGFRRIGIVEGRHLYQGLLTATHEGGFPDAGLIWFKNGERRKFAMAIALRSDFDAAFVRRAARERQMITKPRNLKVSGLPSPRITPSFAGPDFVVIDGAPGLEKALGLVWPATLVQRCTVHKHRNLLAHAPERLHDKISADYNDMIYAGTPKEIETRRKSFIRKWRRPDRSRTSAPTQRHAIARIKVLSEDNR